MKIEYIGEDDWGRKCYKNIETGSIYKDVDGVLHTSTVDGEPCCSLRKGIIIEVLKNG
jgi:hypothetical protein